MAPRKSKNAETFDGQVAVFPGDFAEAGNSQIFIEDSLNWRPLTDAERNFVGTMARNEPMPKNRLSPSTEAGYVQRQAIYQAEKLSKVSVPQNFADLLTKGRLRLHYILNTNGGLSTYLESHKGLIRRVRSNGGQVSAIGGRCVASAGANLFMNCDKEHRYLMPESELMFHLSSCNSDPDFIYDDPSEDDDFLREFTTQARFEEIEELKELLLPAFKKSYREEITTIIDSIPKEAPRRGEEANDCPIEFSGIQAVQAGLCKLTKDPLVTFVKLSGIPREKLRGSLNDALESMAYMPEANEQSEEMMDRLKGMFGHGKK